MNESLISVCHCDVVILNYSDLILYYLLFIPGMRSSAMETIKRIDFKMKWV